MAHLALEAYDRASDTALAPHYQRDRDWGKPWAIDNVRTPLPVDHSGYDFGKIFSVTVSLLLAFASVWMCLCLVVGPWQVWLLVDREGRFPDVRGAVPRAAGTRLEFSNRDATAVLAALADLPPGGETGGPVTLELGPRAAVRARPDQGGAVVELALTDSTVPKLAPWVSSTPTAGSSAA